MAVWYYILGALGGYIITSVFLLKCPILYKKKKLRFRCAHISHRGGAAEKLENTLEAYDHAKNLGTDMLELDVQLTKDKEVVVSHDNHVIRTTGQDMHIMETLFEDLPMLSKEIPVTFHHSTSCSHLGEPLKIPKLEEVFQRYPGFPIHLDVKVYDEELIAKTGELIKKYNRESITPWGNFSNKVTSKLYETDKNIPLLFSATKVLWTVVAFYLGLLPFLPIKESVFAVMMPSAAKKAFPPEFLTRNRRILLSIADFLLMSKVLLRHLSDRGINVYLWVLNDEEDFERAFKKLGATGVMTDFPGKLRTWLNEHPQYDSRKNLPATSVETVNSETPIVP